MEVNLVRYLSATTAHEITHGLIDTSLQNGFDEMEHLTDPDKNDGENGAKDLKYLMYHITNKENVKSIIFDNSTRGQTDLNSKESVERREERR